MRLVRHEIGEHVPDVERQIPPYVTGRRRDPAIGRETQSEESFDTGAASFQRGDELPRPYAVVVDASRCGDAVFAPERLHPPAPGVVKVRSNRPNRALRCAGNRDMPNRRRQTLEELDGDPVIRAPGSKEARLDTAGWSKPQVTQLPLKKLQIVLRQRVLVMEADGLVSELPASGALAGP